LVQSEKDSKTVLTISPEIVVMEQPDTLSRRKFTALSAAAAGALVSGSGRVTALTDEQTDVASRTTKVYRFLLEYVEDGFSIPTLVRFDDESGFDALDALDVSYQTRTGETVAAYAELSPENAMAVIDTEATNQMAYAPGANPFWKLGEYDGRVFPAPEASVGHISFDEARAGVGHLADAHPDRLRVVDIGTGHGFENVYEEQVEPRSTWVLELTDRTTGSFEDKEKLVFNMSVHGDERAGTEASLRLVEDMLRGEYPDSESILEEFVLVFVNPNPDGWVVDQRVYDDPVDPPDFTRVNGALRDLNREQPVTGYVNPSRVVGEPNGSSPDDTTADDVPEQAAEEVPDTLSVVRHLRSYENVEYLVDFHGMYGNNFAVLGLANGGGSLAEHADQTALLETIGSELEDRAGPVSEWEAAFEAASTDTDEQYGCSGGFLCQTPTDLFAYGTPADTIGYTASGAVDGWARQPESAGGLGATAVTTEIVFSNSVRDGMENRFIPDLTAFHVAAYQSVCRATIQHAMDTVETTVETGGRSTAYVDTKSLTRSADDLPHVDESEAAAGAVQSGSTGPPSWLSDESPDRTASKVHSDRTRYTAEGVGTETRLVVPDTAHTLDITVETGRDATTKLRSPTGEVNGGREERASAAQRRTGRSRYTVKDPEPGEWRVETKAPAGRVVDIQTTTLESVQQDSPDPEEVLGYEQRDYEVTPLAVFEQFDAAEPVTVEAVRDGALVDGKPVYDNLVVTHQDGIDEAYIDALTEYVERGGNLVLTDAGLAVATELAVPALEDITDVQDRETRFANYGFRPDERTQSHPLLTDTRLFEPSSEDGRAIFQTEAWQHTVMGYAPGEVPVRGVRGDGLTESIDAAVKTAAETVRLGTASTIQERIGVHFLGSHLPPASQANLHPFGLGDYGLTFFGYQVLCNALGYEVSVTRDGDETLSFGSVVDVTLPEPEAGDESSSEDGEQGSGDNETADGEGSSTPEDTESTAGDSDKTSAGNESAETAPDTSDDGNGTGTGTPDSADGESGTADDDGAGFGFGAGIASLGGVSYLLKQRLGGADESQDED
jgi:hypothetical protein